MAPHPALATIAATQGGPFTTAQALAAGYEEREIARLVRSQAWTRLRRGVLIETNQIPDDEAGRTAVLLRGLGLRARGPLVASHHTAARLHGLTLLDPGGELLAVTRPGVGVGRTEAGVHWHCGALPAGHLVQLGDVCCTSVARTVIDVARESDFRQGLVVAESALNQGLTTLTELRQVHLVCLDWAGARNAGRVVSFASSLSESPGETLSRILFAEHALPEPLQQRYIRDHDGLIGRVDFLWEDEHTIGEFDGRVKYAGGEDPINPDNDRLYKEKRREDRLRDAGFEVVRFGWSDVVSRPERVAANIQAAFARASRRVR